MNFVFVSLVMFFFVFYSFILAQSPLLGWVSMLLVNFYNFTFGVSQVNVGGIHLDPVDVVMIALLVAGLIRTIPRLRLNDTQRLIALGFISILILSVVRGMLENGFTTAANEARGYARPMVAVFYFLSISFDAQTIRKYLGAYLCYGGGLVVVALLAFLGLDVGASAWSHHAAEAELEIDGRYLPADAALAVANCFFLSLGTTGFWKRLRGTGAWLAPIFLGMAIFLRHRTIWVAIIVGLITLFMLDKRTFKRILPMIVVSGAVVIGLLFVAGATVNSSADQFTASATNQGTFMWRVDSWKALLFDKDQTLLTLLIGKSVGSGFWRFDSGAGNYIDVAPHSEYVTYYLRAGFLGAMLYIWYVLRTVKSAWYCARNGKSVLSVPAPALVAMLVVIVTYNVTYFAPQDAYAFFAMANAAMLNLNNDNDQIVCSEDFSIV